MPCYICKTEVGTTVLWNIAKSVLNPMLTQNVHNTDVPHSPQPHLIVTATQFSKLFLFSFLHTTAHATTVKCEKSHSWKNVILWN